MKPNYSPVDERFVPKGNLLMKSGMSWAKKSHSAADSFLSHNLADTGAGKQMETAVHCACLSV